MPDVQPVPEVLVEEEVLKLLRLDNKEGSTTLKYYRDKNLLKATQIGKNLRYTKQEVLNFLTAQTERHNRKSA